MRISENKNVNVSRMQRRSVRVVASFALSANLAGPAYSHEVPSETIERTGEGQWDDTILKDWRGLRPSLHEAGVDIELSYGNEFAANMKGGSSSDATSIGQAIASVSLDMEKIASIAGGSLHGTVTYRHGSSLVDKADLQTLQLVQEAWGRGQTWRLTELYWAQQISPDMNVKFGRLTMGSDFESLGCQFQNLTFCGAAVGNLVGDYWYNWPVSQWGVVAKAKRGDLYVMAGAYEANARNLRNDFALHHKGADGVTGAVELGWKRRLGRRGLPGIYKVGGWYNTQHADDLLPSQYNQSTIEGSTDLARKTGRYGGYFAARQQLTGSFVDDPINGPTTTSGLSVQVNFTQADRRTSRTDNQLTAGMIWTAPLAARPKDELAIAVGRTNVNSRAAHAEQLADPAQERAHAEYAAEFSYGVHLLPGVMIRPNLQYIVHPGGYASNADEVVFGMKSAFNL